jgi:hypothetical protein
VTDLKDKDAEFRILDAGDQPVITDAVLPIAGEFSCERLPQ